MFNVWNNGFRFRSKYESQNKYGISINRIANYYGYWYISDPFDIGSTTINAFKVVERVNEVYPKSINDIDVHMSNYCYYNLKNDFLCNEMKSNSMLLDSLSNGFLMRKTPLSTYCLKFNKSKRLENITDCHILPEFYSTFINLNIEDTQLTNSMHMTFEGAIIYSKVITRLIYFNINYDDSEFSKADKCKNVLDCVIKYCKNRIELHKNKQSIFETGKSCNTSSPCSDIEFLENIISCSKTGQPIHSFKFDINSYYKQQGLFYKALCLSISYLQSLSLKDGILKQIPMSYIIFIKEVINLGGDTDTNAAIVGGILGAYFGAKDLPSDLLNILINFNPKIYNET